MNKITAAAIILALALLCFLLSAFGESYQVGQGRKWHIKSTNNRAAIACE